MARKKSSVPEHQKRLDAFKRGRDAARSVQQSDKYVRNVTYDMKTGMPADGIEAPKGGDEWSRAAERGRQRRGPTGRNLPQVAKDSMKKQEAVRRGLGRAKAPSVSAPTISDKAAAVMKKAASVTSRVMSSPKAKVLGRGAGIAGLAATAVAVGYNASQAPRKDVNRRGRSVKHNPISITITKDSSHYKTESDNNPTPQGTNTNLDIQSDTSSAKAVAEGKPNKQEGQHKSGGMSARKEPKRDINTPAPVVEGGKNSMKGTGGKKNRTGQDSYDHYQSLMDY